MDNKILFTDYNNDIDLCVDGFIIHTALSLSSLHKIEIDLLIDYINKIHDNNKLAIIGLDRIIEEDELSLMHKIIDKVIDKCDFILFSDYSILYYCKQKEDYNKYLNKLIYNPRTYICNIHDFNDIETNAIISNELTIDQILDINDNYDKNINRFLGIKVFGYHQMFYSKRKLITAYNDYFNKNIENNKFYDLKEEHRSELDKIIETDFGTLIYYGHPLLIYEEINKLNNFKFIYLNSELIDNKIMKKITFYYYDYLYNNINHFEEIKKLIPNYSLGFLNKKTVLFKGDEDE